eukprot:Clim_evm256s157 gene=Clim_evmTU256s157
MTATKRSADSSSVEDSYQSSTKRTKSADTKLEHAPGCAANECTGCAVGEVEIDLAQGTTDTECILEVYKVRKEIVSADSLSSDQKRIYIALFERIIQHTCPANREETSENGKGKVPEAKISGENIIGELLDMTESDLSATDSASACATLKTLYPRTRNKAIVWTATLSTFSILVGVEQLLKVSEDVLRHALALQTTNTDLTSLPSDWTTISHLPFKFLYHSESIFAQIGRLLFNVDKQQLSSSLQDKENDKVGNSYTETADAAMNETMSTSISLDVTHITAIVKEASGDDWRSENDELKYLAFEAIYGLAHDAVDRAMDHLPIEQSEPFDSNVQVKEKIEGGTGPTHTRAEDAPNTTAEASAARTDTQLHYLAIALEIVRALSPIEIGDLQLSSGLSRELSVQLLRIDQCMTMGLKEDVNGVYRINYHGSDLLVRDLYVLVVKRVLRLLVGALGKLTASVEAEHTFRTAEIMLLLAQLHMACEEDTQAGAAYETAYGLFYRIVHHFKENDFTEMARKSLVVLESL